MDQIKNNKSVIPKRIKNYLDVYVWLNDPKFGSDVQNPSCVTIAENILFVEMLAVESDYVIMNENRKQANGLIQQIKRKYQYLNACASTNGRLNAFKQSLQQLNKYIKLLLKQQFK